MPRSVMRFFLLRLKIFPSYFCSSGKSLEACIIGSLYYWANNIFQTLLFASNRQEMSITFCKLSSRIFQKNFFLLRLKLGYGWLSEKDEEKTLKERKEKEKAIFPSLMICFLLILLKCGQTTSFCKVQKNCHHWRFFSLL